MTGEPEILFETRGPLALATFNRPKALNALSLGMIEALVPQLDAWAADPAIAAVVLRGAGDRAFCAGGDIRVIYESGRGDGVEAARFFREEYRFNHRVFHFPKPYISLVDGIVMGGGVGASVHGSHWVATGRTLFAMPETGIGMFPDVGGSWFLPRLPGKLGLYLGLTGARLKAADCRYAGIATHFVPEGRLEALVEALAATDWSAGAPLEAASATLDAMAADPGPAPLAGHRAAIDRCFAAGSVEGILAALEGEGDDWARETVETLRSRSPTALKVTFRQLREGTERDFDASMVVEYRLSRACVAGHDFLEGIRAVVVDKDNRPVWDPPSLERVDEARVARHFRPLGDQDLSF